MTELAEVICRNAVRALFSLGVLALAGGRSATAQAPAVHGSQATPGSQTPSISQASSAAAALIRFTRTSDALGLSHNSVYAINQDSSGFLWVATADGLNSYDGYGFRVYRHDPTDTTSLSSNLIWDIHLDRRGTLWVATSHGLDRYVPETERFARYMIPGPPREAVPQSRILEDSGGRLWVASGVGIFVYDPDSDRVRPLPLASGTHPGPATALEEDANGEVWVARRGPPVALVGVESGRRITVEGATWVSTFHTDADGQFWLGPGVSAMPPGDVTDIRLQWPADLGLVWDIATDADGTLWFATGRGLYRMPPGGEPELHLLDPSERAYVFNYARSVFVDRTGAVWVGTHGGLFRYDPYAKQFVHLPGDPANRSQLSGSAVSALHVDPDGNTWVGTLGRGLNRIDANTGTIERFEHRPDDPMSLPHDRVWALHGDRPGRLWVGTQIGLAELDLATGRFHPHPLPGPAGVAGPVRRIASATDGRLWITGSSVIYRYDPRTTRAEVFFAGGSGGTGPSHRQLFAIIPTPDGVWFGAGGSHLDFFDTRNGSFSTVELRADDGEPLSGEGIWDAHRDSSGILWLGTGSGLGRYDPTAHAFSLFTTADGLPGSVVYSVQPDRAGRLWLGTNQGLSRFDPRALPGVQFRNFDLADGIGSLEFNRAAAFEAPGGELLFGGMNGLTRFFPEAITENPVAPPIVLTGVTTASDDGVRRHVPAGLKWLDLPHEESTISFEFAALSFTNSAQNRYEYRLEPVETQWVEAGATRVARYPRLPPGDYRFVVRGSNNDGVWNEEGTSLSFRIAPPLWKTWWFRGLALALAALALYAVYRYRLARILAVERLRMSIAGDLHDDLSSNLSGIALMSEMVGRGKHLAEHDRSQLTRISEAARRMVDDVRDMVWIVDTGHDSLEDLSLKMKDAAAALLGAHEYRFETLLDGTGERLPVEFRRHTYLALKEMLHNVVRHACATAVVIAVRSDHSSLRLSVEDDGIGFESGAGGGSDRFHSLRRRAEALGGELDVRSRPGEGTRVTLYAPIPRSRKRAMAIRRRVVQR